MKKSIGLLIILLVLPVSVYAGTDPNRWDGFRGLKWATNIKDVNDPNMIVFEDHNKEKYYRRLNDKLSIGDAKLENVDYVFYKDRFFGVMIEAKGYKNFTALKNAVFAYYGEGKQSKEITNLWAWLPALGNSDKDVRIFLTYNENGGETTLVMNYIPIDQEKAADAAKKAKEASKDF